jgi:hypothetical protein
MLAEVTNPNMLEVMRIRWGNRAIADAKRLIGACARDASTRFLLLDATARVSGPGNFLESNMTLRSQLFSDYPACNKTV